MGQWSQLAEVARQHHEERNKDKIAANLVRWRADPVEFYDECFGFKAWLRQREVMRSVRDHKRTAVRSGHKVSKSNTAAAIGLWWAITRPEGRVICTATTAKQIRNIIWREVRSMHRKAMQIGNVWFPKPAIQPSNGIQWANGREFIGQTAEDTEAMSGLSGPDMLFIVDEASGVHPDIFVAIRGNMAGGASLLLISNPSQPSGDFYNAFHDHAELYNCIHIRSDESPNISHVDDFEVIGVPKAQRIPGLAMPSYVRESRIEYGPDWQNSPLYHIRVLGNFPQQSELCVIGAGDVLSAIAGYKDATFEGTLNLGVDVAHFGDDETSVTALRGFKALPALTVNGFTEQRTACMVADALRSHWKFGEPDAQIKIDTGGGYGTELVTRLRDPDDKCWSHNWVTCADGSHVWERRKELSPWLHSRPPIQVYEVNGSCASTVLSPNTKLPEYYNLRSQLWFEAGKWLKAGGTFADDKKLQTELVTPKYSLKKNKRLVEPKTEIKKRLKRSPDRADSLTLAIYQPASMVLEGTESEHDYPDDWGQARGYG